MKNFWARVLTLIIFFPLLAVVIFPLRFLHHLVFNAIVAAVAFLGALEMKKMLKTVLHPKWQKMLIESCNSFVSRWSIESSFQIIEYLSKNKNPLSEIIKPVMEKYFIAELKQVDLQ